MTDISGAAIPGVRMSLENADTGVTVEVESNEIGYYRFSLLRPDTYTLRAELPGFNIASVSDIVLQVAKTSDVNISLEPSTVQEVVTVAASAITVDSQTSDLGEVVAERPVKKLPLLLRDPTYLVNLVPGVTADHRSQTGGQDRNGLSWQGRLIFTAQARQAASAEVAFYLHRCADWLSARALEAYAIQRPDSYRTHQLRAEYFDASGDHERAIAEY